MIKSVSIKNFRGIKELNNLKFGQGPTFLIGQNGAGKSTFISAIYLTQRLLRNRNLDIVFYNIDPFGNSLVSHGYRGNNTEFSLCIRGKEGFYRFSYSIGGDDDGYFIMNEKLEKINREYELVELVYERLDEGIRVADGKVIPLHINRSELVLSGYNEKFTRDAALTLSSYEVLWLNGNSDARFRIYRKEEAFPSNLDSMAVKLYKNDKDSFDNAVEVIKTMIPNFLAPEIREISPSNSQKESEDTRYMVFWNEAWVDGSTLQYNLPILSDGNMRIIQLIFSIFSSRGLTCIVGEEIENGQYFGRIKTLLEVLKTMSVKRDIQMIFTTHSMDLLSNVAPSDVVYLEKSKDGFTTFKNLDEKVDVDYIRDILGHEPTPKELLDMGVV